MLFVFKIFILLNSFWQILKGWDVQLFLKINREWTNPFLDNFLPLYRDMNFWIPFYLFLLVFVVMNYGWKSWTFIAALIITVAINDQMSSDFFKNFVNRQRPCQDEFLIHYARLLLSRCPSSQSFTSSHATNHFGIAMFLYVTLKNVWRKWSYLLFVWAATISYSQVYVGVHYPLDIIGGALVGCLIGYTTANFYIRKIGMPVSNTS
jgi:undecaprenyl-diphosphatase